MCCTLFMAAVQICNTVNCSVMDEDELAEIAVELDSIEESISTLLARQSMLMERRSVLEEKMSSVGKKSPNKVTKKDMDKTKDWSASFPWTSALKTHLH